MGHDVGKPRRNVIRIAKLAGVCLMVLGCATPWGSARFKELCATEAGLKIFEPLPKIQSLYFPSNDYYRRSECDNDCTSSLLGGADFVDVDVQNVGYANRLSRRNGLHRYWLVPEGSPQCAAFYAAYPADSFDIRNILKRQKKCLAVSLPAQTNAQYVYESDRKVSSVSSEIWSLTDELRTPSGKVIVRLQDYWLRRPNDENDRLFGTLDCGLGSQHWLSIDVLMRAGR